MICLKKWTHLKNSLFFCYNISLHFCQKYFIFDLCPFSQGFQKMASDHFSIKRNPILWLKELKIIQDKKILSKCSFSMGIWTDMLSCCHGNLATVTKWSHFLCKIHSFHILGRSIVILILSLNIQQKGIVKTDTKVLAIVKWWMNFILP